MSIEQRNDDVKTNIINDRDLIMKNIDEIAEKGNKAILDSIESDQDDAKIYLEKLSGKIDVGAKKEELTTTLYELANYYDGKGAKDLYSLISKDLANIKDDGNISKMITEIAFSQGITDPMVKKAVLLAIEAVK